MKNLLLCLLCLTLPALAKPSAWVSNKETAIRLIQVRQVTRWDQLPPQIRLNNEVRESIKPLMTALSGGEYKILLVSAELRNDSKAKRELGFSFGSSYDTAVFLRGEEGTEVRSYGTWSYEAPAAASQLTYYLKGGMPMRSEVPPKGVIRGEISYMVPEWFKPVQIFTKAGRFGAQELKIKL